MDMKNTDFSFEKSLMRSMDVNQKQFKNEEGIYDFHFPLLKLITNGEHEELVHQMDPSFFSYFDRVLTTQEDAKNTFIIYVGLSMYAAVDGGVMLEIAVAMSQEYLKQVPSLKNIADVKSLLSKMMIDFAEESKKAKMCQTSSPLVKKCFSYIFSHVYEPVTLNVLAREVGCSQSHLQRCFKSAVGLTITEYIRKEKMSKACFLLKHTSLSCVEIAQHLSICSQSYFSSQFKKEIGMTPKSYRNHTTT